MKRLVDLILLLMISIPSLAISLVICIVIKTSSKGPILFWSERVGKNGKIFKMAKFRSMHVGTPVVATHLIDDPNKYLSSVGSFLRKTSLDELPQLISVLKGQMSFVGPRPALFNQNDLIYLRKKEGIEKLTPGITGWAQINGRDELNISEKVKFDKYYLDNKSVFFDLRIIALTVIMVITRDGVTH